MKPTKVVVFCFVFYITIGYYKLICIASPENKKNISKLDKINIGHTLYLTNQTVPMKLEIFQM